MPFGGENAESYFDDGITASMKGDLKRALQCFERALKLDPAYLAARHQLAKCLLRMGQSSRAIDLLHSVVRHKPEMTAARLDLGSALLTGGMAAPAKAEFEKALTLDPSNWRAQLGLAQTAFLEGRWDVALRQAQAALLCGGRSFAVLWVLGRAAKLTGNASLALKTFDEADALIKKSLELAPDSVEGHFLRGEVAMAMDQFATAVEEYRAASVHAQPETYYTAFGENFTWVDILARQGVCYQRLDRAEQAHVVARQILAIDPEHKLAKSLLPQEK